MAVKSKDGEMAATFSDKTSFKRVSPEKPDLASALPAERSDIGIGDKVILTGVPAADGRSVPARSVYLMTKGDLAQKSAKDLEQWRTRGINGKVVSADQATSTVTVQIASLTGNTTVALTAKPKAKFLRYAPDSIRFDEAKVSSMSEIHPGDMLRALGDKSPDGARFEADEVVTGAFQTIAGTVRSVDAQKNEVLIKDLRSGKDVTVVISETSVVKRFPPEMAERMAAFQTRGGGARPPGGGQPGEGSPPVQGQGQGQGGGRGFGGARAGGIDDMLDRFPAITVADLKPGDMVALSSSKGVNVDRVKAIKLLAGVEPFLRMAQAAGGQRGQQGVQGGLNIPGLDGFSFP
jgi:hypothetical protein